MRLPIRSTLAAALLLLTRTVFGAASFDGTSNATAVQTTAKVTAAPLTICLWLKPTATNTYKDFAIAKSTDYNELFYIRWNNGGHFEAGTGHGGSFGASTAAASYSANVWSSGCGVYASSTSRVAYFNGTAATANTTSLVPSGLNQTETGPVSPVFMQGLVAEIGIWSRALSADEITTLQHYAPNCLTRGLVTYTPALGVRSSLLADYLSGTGAEFSTGSGVTDGSDHPPISHCNF